MDELIATIEVQAEIISKLRREKLQREQEILQLRKQIESAQPQE